LLIVKNTKQMFMEETAPRTNPAIKKSVRQQHDSFIAVFIMNNA